MRTALPCLLLTLALAGAASAQGDGFAAAKALHDRAEEAYARGDYPRALESYQKAVAAAEKHYGGKPHRGLFRFVIDLGQGYAAVRRWPECLAAFDRAAQYLDLPGAEPVWRIELHYIRGRHRLNGCNDAKGALPDLRRCWELSERAGPRELRVDGGTQLATALSRLDDPKAALPIAKQALEEGVRAFGKDVLCIRVGWVVAELAGQAGDHETEMREAQRALAVAEEIAPESRDVATSSLVVARSLRNVAKDYRAPLERALRLYERLEPGSGDLGGALCDHALMLAQGRQYEAAREQYARARAIYERLRDADRVAFIDRQVQLVSSDERGQSGGAIDYVAEATRLERELAREEKGRPADHPRTPEQLMNIAVMFANGQAWDRSRAAAARARSLLEPVVGPRHRSVCYARQAEAYALARLGRGAEAEAVLEPALELPRSSPSDPYGWSVLRAVAFVRQAQGRRTDAADAMGRRLDAVLADARRRLPLSSPAERLSVSKEAQDAVDEWVMMTQGETSGYAGVISGRSLATRWALSERRASAADRKAFEALSTARAALATLVYAAPAEEAAQATYTAELAAAQQRCDELSRQTAASGGGPWMWATAKQVIDQLREGEVLVDLDLSQSRARAWVLRHRKAPERVELGEARPIAQAAELFRTLARDPETPPARLQPAGAELRRLVWAPVEPLLGEADLVYLMLGPQLADVPFAALPGKTPGRCLIDELTFVHLSVPQDLVPAPQVAPVGAGVVAVGGVEYEGRFEPLAATGVEAQRAGGWFASTYPREERLVLTGRVTEGRLREGVRGKRLVHLATHGYVVEGAPGTVGGVDIDPLVFSGLALTPGAGAAGDGVLTALELGDFDLGAAEVLVLSACDSARGARKTRGEGVLGLVRGARIAGARAVVASLWPVSDIGTAVLMERFYNMWLGQGGAKPLAPARALREAALRLRDLEVEERDAAGRPRKVRPCAAPAFWAAFVAYGGARPSGQ